MSRILPTAIPVLRSKRVTAKRSFKWRRSGWTTRFWQLMVFLVVIGIWQVAAEMKWGRPLYVSSPVEVWHELYAVTVSGVLWRNLAETLKAMTIAFVLASATGISAGLGLSMMPRLDAVLAPYINALNSLPRIALAPLFVLVFGIGIESKIALAFSVVFFILLISAQAGVKGADQDIMRMARMLDFDRRRQFTKILLPLATPSIFAGVRLGIIYSLLGVVTGEIIAAKAGVGQLIMFFSGRFEIAGIYAVLFVLAIVAASIDILTGALERWLLRWADSSRPQN